MTPENHKKEIEKLFVYVYMKNGTKKKSLLTQIIRRINIQETGIKIIRTFGCRTHHKAKQKYLDYIRNPKRCSCGEIISYTFTFYSTILKKEIFSIYKCIACCNHYSDFDIDKQAS